MIIDKILFIESHYVYIKDGDIEGTLNAELWIKPFEKLSNAFINKIMDKIQDQYPYTTLNLLETIKPDFIKINRINKNQLEIKKPKFYKITFV